MMGERRTALIASDYIADLPPPWWQPLRRFRYMRNRRRERMYDEAFARTFGVSSQVDDEK